MPRASLVLGSALVEQGRGAQLTGRAHPVLAILKPLEARALRYN